MKDVTKPLVIDATGGILGRVAAYAAKQLLRGREVVVVNCDHALLTGRKVSVINEYKQARARGGTSMRGPFFPKEPFRIMKRTIRGMLPNYRWGRGRVALKRAMCYNDVPKEYEAVEKFSLKRELRVSTMTLSELSGNL